MFKSLKRVLATTSVLALLVSNVGVAFAQTFKDVPNDAWYYDYVEQLVNDGVVDVGDNFHPDSPLNRAELAKMVITSIDGLADYTAPSTPTFDDVPASAWYYDYVEAAVQLNIVGGYADAKGNLTGKFGPGDTVNRAAATKVLVNAYGVETTLEPASIFPDVKMPAWYYDFVVTAYNQSILDGYANGKFGPGDPVTRAQVAKLMVNAQNPVLRSEVTPPSEGVTPPVVNPAAKGALEVSLNDTTAASSTLPQNASSVKLASFDFTAADSDVTVSNLVVTRGGVGKAGDWDALYLYEGTNRLTTGRTVNNDTNTATFAVNFTVDAGTTKTLTLVGDVTTAPGASNQHYFYISTAADVTTGAKSVSGDFPVAGNTFTMGGNATAVNDITVTTGSAISQPQIGQMDAEVASFKLKAGSSNDIAVHQVSLTQNGSLSSSKLINLKLLRGSDEVATAKAFDGDRVTFVLTAPYVVPKGQTKSFYVHADIDGGRTTDTVQLYLDENTDLTVIDQQYGYGAVVKNPCGVGNVNGFKPAAGACVGVAATNLKGGAFTVSDNGPAGKQIAQNTTNVQLLNYSVTAGRDLTVKNMDLDIDMSTAGGPASRPNVVALGAGTIYVGAANLAASTTATVAAVPALVNAETFTIGSCVVSFVTGPGADEVNCVDNLATINMNLAGPVLRTGAQISAVIDTLTNVTDPVLGALTVGAGAADTTVFTDTVVTAGNITTVNDGAKVTFGTVVTGTLASTTTAVAYTTAGATAGIGVNDEVSIPTAGATVYAIVTGVAVNGAQTVLTTNANVVSNVIAGTVQEVNPYNYIKNVKVVDLDSGSTLQGPMTKASDGTVTTAGGGDHYIKTMPEDYELVGGEARHLSVQVDVGQELAAGYQIAAKIDYSTVAGYVKDMAANENVIASDIVGGILTGKFMSTAANSLSVTRGSVPSSNTYVQGTDNVPALGISLKAGDAGDIIVKKLTVRVYGNTAAGAWAVNGLGNHNANDYVSSVTLYDGSDVLAGGAKSLTLNGSPYAANASYYKALFDNLNLKVTKGNTKSLTAKVKLLNGLTANVYVALDMDPANDVVAEDADSNTITASGAALNAGAAHAPLLTIAQSGTLTISTSNPPAAKLLTAGSTKQLMASYEFHAEQEDWNVNKVTLLNDLAGPFAVAAGVSPVDTTAVANVMLEYKDISGNKVEKTSDLSGGTRTISDLGFFVPAGKSEYLNVYAYLNTRDMAGESISGQTLRLGIQDTANTSTTFEAKGASSSVDAFNPGAMAGVIIPDSANIKSFVVRNAVPVFAKVTTGLDSNLNQGGADRLLLGFSVTADGSGSVEFSRLVFDVTNRLDATGGTASLANLKFYRGTIGNLEDLTQGTVPTVNMWNATEASNATSTVLAINAAKRQVIVSFNTKQTIAGGTSQTFYLSGTLAGITALQGQGITVALANGDDNANPGVFAATGGTGFYTVNNGNVNTTRMYGVNDSSGLFSAAADVGFCLNGAAGTTAWYKLVGTNFCNVLWSDGSAVSHAYPTVVQNAGPVYDMTVTTGTYDWTNGFLLNLSSAVTYSISK